jgi:hypothetical protein
MRLRAHVELFTGHKIKTLRSDGGGEYMSYQLADYLADAGILHQTSCPNSSQQNGIAERYQCTLFDRVRCLLNEAGMSWGWWGEAAMTATYLYNRTPHSALPDSVSPLSFWSNKSVSISHIRVFGTVCYSIDTSKDRKKSSPRAIECCLLGYDALSKAYRLQVKGSTKILRSRDVIFHEHYPADPSSSHGISPAPAVPSDLDCPPSDRGAMHPGELQPVAAEAAPNPGDSVGESPSSVGDLLESVGETGDPMATEPVVERPRRERKQTWKLRESVQSNVASIPKSYREAMKGTEAEQWSEAVVSEFTSWSKNEVYEVVPRPGEEEIIPAMLLFDRKTDETGAEVRKKARCVARGDMQAQTPGDGPMLASPVAGAPTLQAMAGVAASTNCEFQQMDVKTAFLHVPLSRPVYLAIPVGFPESELLPGVPRSAQSLRLKKAVYGLREAPYSWYTHCTGILKTEGFVRSDNDHCLFWIYPPGSTERCFVLIYVDDFTLMTKSAEHMDWLKSRLASLFDLKDLGAANQVLVATTSVEKCNVM